MVTGSLVCTSTYPDHIDFIGTNCYIFLLRIMSTMEQVIKRCTETIDFVSKQEIPKACWKDCAGVAIINITEVGFIFSLEEGDGIVIKRNDDGTWGAPSCIAFEGSGAGAIFGKGNKKLVLFPLTKYGLSQLTADNKYQLGAQVGLTLGALGRELSAAGDAGGHGADVTVSYVFAEGALLNVGIENNFISAANEVNEAFYGKKVTANQIVFEGAVDIPKGKGVEELQAKLAELCK